MKEGRGWKEKRVKKGRERVQRNIEKKETSKRRKKLNGLNYV